MNEEQIKSIIIYYDVIKDEEDHNYLLTITVNQKMYHCNVSEISLLEYWENNLEISDGSNKYFINTEDIEYIAFEEYYGFSKLTSDKDGEVMDLLHNIYNQNSQLRGNYERIKFVLAIVIFYGFFILLLMISIKGG